MPPTLNAKRRTMGYHAIHDYYMRCTGEQINSPLEMFAASVSGRMTRLAGAL